MMDWKSKQNFSKADDAWVRYYRKNKRKVSLKPLCMSKSYIDFKSNIEILFQKGSSDFFHLKVNAFPLNFLNDKYVS